MKTKSTFSLRKFLTAIKVLLFIILFFCSCNSQKEVLLGDTRPKTLPEKVTGAYVIVYPADKKSPHLRGELIAANDQVITLLTDTVLRDVPLATCGSIKLFISKDVNNRAALTFWAVVLPLSTIIHGALLVFTFPLNLAVVVPTIFSIHGKYITSYPDRIGKEMLPKFARFPQGLPAGISYNSLK